MADNNFTSIEYQKRQLKILYRKIYDELLKLDLYAQPLSLTYKGKNNYSTVYGVVMTIITFCLVMIVIIDTLVFGQTSTYFQYDSSMGVSTTLNIDFSKEI